MNSGSMVPSSAPERGADVRFPPPLVFLSLTLLGVLFDYLVMKLPVPVDRSLALIVSVVAAVIAIALGISARMLFVRTGQSPIPWKPSPELIFQGPYRFTRNPMYVGLTLLQVGLGFALDDLW